MKIEEVLATYNARYAAEYDATFLHDVWSRESLAFQMRTLEDLLMSARSWLDVACGTGWVLSQFPHVVRCGLDISPHMLDIARARNPEVSFLEGNYRHARTEWNDRWDVVSCMWWAYCLAETMSEIRELVARLADWTAPDGTVFVPLCNPRKFDRHNIRIPYVDPKVPGRLMITGITWTWIQENGMRHDNVLVPQIDYLVAMFREHFEQVNVVQGDLDTIGEGWLVQDILVASGKKAAHPSSDLYAEGRTRPPGESEWLLWTERGAKAHVEHLTPDFDTIRVVIEDLGGHALSAVRISKQGLRPEATAGHRIVFRARASSARSITVRIQPKSGSLATHDVLLTTEWTEYVLGFGPVTSEGTLDVHFDIGAHETWVELTAVEWPSRP